MGNKIVFLDSHTSNPHKDLSWEDFHKLGTFTAHENLNQEAEILSVARDAEILIGNKVAFTDQLINQLPSLKLICVAATGYNNVDLEACKSRGIQVFNVSGYSTPGVVHQVFALIFGLINRVESYSAEVKQGDWAGQEYFSYQHKPWNELQGKIFGIFGFGTIGQAVAKVALAFGMEVIATKRSSITMAGVKLVSSEELFEKSDILSLHASLNSETEGIINKKSLAQMKPSAILINTARGGLIHEEDLAEALSNNLISGAGLDVLLHEPPAKDHEFYGLANCLITPHQAWSSLESRQRLLDGIASNIKSFQEGELTNRLV